MSHSEKTIRVGVLGIGRGKSFAEQCAPHGMKLVAICDSNQDKLAEAKKQYGAETYTEYERFLEHDMDAVILANYYHEHAPFAISALEAGLHVMSETAACLTLAQGVALARAVEKSGKIYMFAENCPFSAINQEMRRVYREGRVGEFQYGEGEYLHPVSAWTRSWYTPGWNHWRAWLPATYYCTHSMGPITYITDLRPVKVNGFVVPYDKTDPQTEFSPARTDMAGMIVCRMENGSLVKLLQVFLRPDSLYVRIHGNRGMMEHSRERYGLLRIVQPEFDRDEDTPDELFYSPGFRAHAENAKRTAHGGSDFFVNHHFAEAIRTGEQPFLDVYRGLDMSIIGILAYRSALNDSAPEEVPDFRKEEVRKGYEKDNWSPDPEQAGPGQPSSSILGKIEKSPEAIAFCERCWAEQKKHNRGESWTKYNMDGSVFQEYERYSEPRIP